MATNADYQPNDAPKGPPKSHFQAESLALLSLIVIFGIFASTLPQPQVLGKIPLQNILKNQLHVSRGEMGSFFFWVGVFWYLKPVAGILTDAFPIFKTRRRHYILLSAILAAASWILIIFIPHTYGSLLAGCILAGLFMVMMSTVTGAFLVEVGQEQGATGRLTSVRQFVSNFCSLIQGPLGGLLATGAFGVVAGVNSVIVFSIFPIAYFLLKEKPLEKRNTTALQDSGAQIATIIKSGTFWMTILFVALFYFAPGFGTMQFYRQQDQLHFSTVQIGILTSFGGLGGIIASIAYGFITKKLDLRVALFFGVATSAAGTLLYLFYNNLTLAYGIDFQNGLFFGFCEIAILHLAAKSTPKGCEGLGYSIILSVRNLALFGADAIGSNLADKFHIAWSVMVLLNAATTGIVLILLPFMPVAVMRSKDGEAA